MGKLAASEAATSISHQVIHSFIVQFTTELKPYQRCTECTGFPPTWPRSCSPIVESPYKLPDLIGGKVSEDWICVGKQRLLPRNVPLVSPLMVCSCCLKTLVFYFFSAFKSLVVWVMWQICQQRDTTEMQESQRFMKEQAKCKELWSLYNSWSNMVNNDLKWYSINFVINFWVVV